MNDRLLLLANCLTHAQLILEEHLVQQLGSNYAVGLLLQSELGLVLEHARSYAGLNPDGTFDQVPPAARKTAAAAARPPARAPVLRRSADARLTKRPPAKKGGGR